MKSIPSRLLCHCAEAISSSEPDLWGKVTEEVVANLNHVRLVREEKLAIDKQNNQVRQDAALYYDCKISKPAEFDFTKIDCIRHNNINYRIISVKPCEEFNRLHHIEVKLAL